MDNLLHFAAEEKDFPGEAFLALGYGFTEEGLWRERPLPEAEALAVDDRFLPTPEGLDRALEVLRGWTGWILCDFERPPAEPLIRLLEGLAGRTVVVPPAYEKHPRWGVLAGPYQPGQSFARWLGKQKERYGRVVLDAAPLRCRVRPGHRPEPWPGPLPEVGFPCPGAGCLCAGASDGSLLFWDTRASLRDRCRRAGAPTIVLAEEWAGLQEALPAAGDLKEAPGP